MKIPLKTGSSFNNQSGKTALMNHVVMQDMAIIYKQIVTKHTEEQLH